MGKLFRDDTGKTMISIMRRQLAVMELQAADKMAELTTNLAEIHELVRSGVAQELLDYGDRVNVAWKDTEANQEHVAPHNVVHFGDVELEDGEIIPGMFLQWHYCTPYGIPFDAPEALYYASAGLPAGTYNFEIQTTWSKALAGTYQFTLTQAIPAGGQVGPIAQLADTEPSNWSVTTYTGPTDTTGIETVAVTSGSAGTSLGTLKHAGDGNMNSIHRVGYGYNRWSQSAIRQWLNSAAGPGAWWTPQNNWDRPPAEAATKSGFLAGYGEDFLACIKPVKVVTALNTIPEMAQRRQLSTRSSSPRCSRSTRSLSLQTSKETPGNIGRERSASRHTRSIILQFMRSIRRMRSTPRHRRSTVVCALRIAAMRTIRGT